MTQPKHLIVVELAERFRKKTGHDLSRSRHSLERLLEAVDGAVRALQDQDVVDVTVPQIAVTRRGPLTLDLQLTRDDALRAGEVRSVEHLLD